MIKITNATKIYNNSVLAIDNISLEFKNKELVFIVGGSGNGKSTLLNVLGGLDNLTSGNISINDKNINESNSFELSKIRNSYFGYVFQEFYFDENLNVLDNILLSIEKNNIDVQTIYNLSDKLKIKHLLERKTNELSGGEKQRVQILRSLVKNPQVILADEPTGNLDNPIKKDIYQIFKEISNNDLVIIVSHDLDMARIFADRIITLDKGKVILDEQIKKKSYFVNNELMDLSELTTFIDSNPNDNLSLEIKRKIEEKSPKQLDNVKVKENKKISSKFIRKYDKELIKHDKVNYIFNVFISSFLLCFLMFILFLISYKSNDTVKKYLNNNFYNDYILYNEVAYTNDFEEEFNKSFYTGKNFYNDLVSNNLNVKPVINENVIYNDYSINTNVIIDTEIDSSSCQISDYFSYKNKISLNDTLYFNNKAYVVDKIIETDYNKYKYIFESSNIKYNQLKSELLQHINFVKINYQNIKSNTLIIPFSNFTISAFQKYSNSYCSLSANKDLNISSNEIIISKKFALENGIEQSDLGKTYYFKNIRDKKYNNFYDDQVNMYDYYNNGFVLKDIIDDNNSDFYLNYEIFEQITFDYDYYTRPSFYLVDNSSNLLNLNYYKFEESNISSFYLKGLSFDENKAYLIIIFISFVMLLCIYYLMNLNQSYNKYKKNFGLFLSFGYDNTDISKIYLYHSVISNCLISLISIIFYNFIYFIYEDIQKYKMIYNPMFQDKYKFIVYIIILLNFILHLLISTIKILKFLRKKPINLIHNNL